MPNTHAQRRGPCSVVVHATSYRNDYNENVPSPGRKVHPAQEERQALPASCQSWPGLLLLPLGKLVPTDRTVLRFVEASHSDLPVGRTTNVMVWRSHAAPIHQSEASKATIIAAPPTKRAINSLATSNAVPTAVETPATTASPAAISSSLSLKKLISSLRRSHQALPGPLLT